MSNGTIIVTFFYNMTNARAMPHQLLKKKKIVTSYLFVLIHFIFKN